MRRIRDLLPEDGMDRRIVWFSVVLLVVLGVLLSIDLMLPPTTP